MLSFSGHVKLFYVSSINGLYAPDKYCIFLHIQNAL
jgi:hypothetical protein